MIARFRSAVLLIFLVMALPLGALAQGQYAGSVAAVDGDVLVLKPRSAQGPATVYVYRQDGTGGWEVVEQLRPEGAESSGEAFSASMILAGGELLVGGADPEAQWGAHAFRRDATGNWSAGDKVPLVAESAGGDAAWDLAALMRILQPPPRVVAADGDRALVAVVGGPARTSGVRVFERTDGSGTWREEARLEGAPSGASDRFGFAVAIRGNQALVGAPGQGTAGAAYLFTRNESTGSWRQDTMLTVRGPAGGGFGSTVMFDGDVVLIGAPGHAEAAGFVVAYARNAPMGAWVERGRLLPSGGAFGDLFGTALAVGGDDLLVGAPGAEDRRGRVHRFSRTSDGSWQSVGAMTVPDVEPGFAVGSAVSFDGDVAVVAAPGADARNGRAGVFTRTAGGDWTHDTWLSLDHTFETIVGDEVRCDEGQAAQFDCSDVDLLAFLPVSALGGGPGSGVSDVWGWTDGTTGREYALVARTGGVAAVDVTDPSAPAYLGLLSAGAGSALDVKVYADHAFFIGGGEATAGMLIFDLTMLRGITNAPVTFEPNARYDGIASAHNLIIDTSSGFAYIVGANGGRETCGGGLHMVDIRSPAEPTFAGCYTDTEGLIWAGRTHDGQCVEYHGPDENYQGRQVCFASNETALRIVDVTDKASPAPIAAATYPGMAYVHQGWLTDDHRYFYMDDELDELTGLAETTRTLVWDVAELDDPIMVAEYFGPTKATDHNLYVKGNRIYLANYQAGLRVIDITDRENPVEVGFFDTTPYEGNPPTMGGAWTAYPFFESGTIIVSSTSEGLFILRPSQRPVLIP